MTGITISMIWEKNRFLSRKYIKMAHADFYQIYKDNSQKNIWYSYFFIDSYLV